MSASLGTRRERPSDDFLRSAAKLAAPLAVLAFCAWLLTLGLHRSHTPHHLRQPDIEPGYVSTTPAGK